jgi:hypothetical protein
MTPIDPSFPWLTDYPWGVADASDGAQIQCPVCWEPYQHHAGTEQIDGKDAYKAWGGRGDVVLVRFDGECGHRWSLRFGFHKGNIYVFWHDEGTTPDFGEGAMTDEDRYHVPEDGN